VLAGIEAGGTKFECAVGTGPGDLRSSRLIPTTTPAETLGRVVEFFREQERAGLEIAALGIASFGPLDLSPTSPTYGHITTTPKPGWAGTDLVGILGSQLTVPVALDTDVNGAAYGEYRWGAGRGLGSSVYLTIGTGIGGGAVVRGEPLRGLLHPEMGHVTVRRHPDDDFEGSCPFHGDCIEGLASGPAIEARTGRSPHDLGEQLERTVELEAWYLAQLVSTVIYVLSPERIVMGGGVMNLTGLREAVRTQTLARLAGSLDGAGLASRMDTYLVAPGLPDSSGVLGAIALAEIAARRGGEAPGSTSAWPTIRVHERHVADDSTPRTDAARTAATL